ncbi:rhodanese-like domain-containing protein [Brochothrix thermosphacta]|uniref:rhodanese-like domain-containing protein n=1 Tax=Brochothrix sp. TaxID=1993875 RepID=UPI000564DA24|nr:MULTISPECIES: rhodanese-like domain-containing protein [Brochothrix]ANZ95887.1 rhodanese-like domain-containing protein [Brochothrix thermosphacta]ANZ97979.1 rhodanese-like domain-containing protein [Brochothrix thermosphacta]MDO7863398.1 rhodanese-like domain-containing protein [Brochothrix thermosphacta]ODJ47987.1 rhodanese-like domain-containing protein [Brochothrix thermosphacta DSM 20171 = FSL F6-1036]ODJ52502.1 rhodanese-like domain-containing protein [Brochothrix thermosphacta]
MSLLKFLITLLVVIAAIVLYQLYFVVRARRIVTRLTEDEFKQGYRKAQLIDVREQREFDAGHILGARNIPFSQFRQRSNELRTDLPIYIYCQGSARSNRFAIKMAKKGAKDIYQLKGGYQGWKGKTKAK